MALKHVIIGNGPAGISAAGAIRSRNKDDEIVLLTDEPCLSYSRTLLPDFIAGRIPLEKLWLYPDSYYEEHAIEVRLNAKVASVHPEKNLVTTENGAEISFDRLLIACGGLPKIPAIEGIDKVKALTLKTLADAQKIIASVKKGSSVLVLARDLVGVEMTRAFSQMGMRVTYIEWGDELLPHIIDPATAEELAQRMRAAGVTMVVGDEILRAESSGDGVLIRTATRVLEGDVLSIAIGKFPSLEWLKPSGIKLNSGIIADERLRTNYPNIFVAGDAAEVYDSEARRRKLLFGWKNALEQGKIAGANMAGDMQDFRVNYKPGLKQIFGVDVRHRWK